MKINVVYKEKTPQNAKFRPYLERSPEICNLYHYAGNNPVRFKDPSGAFDFDTNTIEEGDTLNQIADDCNRKYGTNYTADDLQNLNKDKISNKDLIYAGDTLNLGDVGNKPYTYPTKFTVVKDKYGNILGYGAEAEKRKILLENSPKLNISLYASGNIGVVQGNTGLSLISDYGSQNVSMINGMDIGIYTPGIGLNATIGLMFPGNLGLQNHSMGLSIFGFGGDVSFSEKGLTGFNLGISTNPGYKGDSALNDFGIGYSLIK